jgi:hypothetical protein
MDNLTIAVVCPSSTRVSVLADWTMRELKSRNLTQLADIFLFTATSPVSVSPVEFFFNRHWRSASEPTAVKLLETSVPLREGSEVVFRTA